MNRVKFSDTVRFVIEKEIIVTSDSYDSAKKEITDIANRIAAENGAVGWLGSMNGEINPQCVVDSEVVH